MASVCMALVLIAGFTGCTRARLPAGTVSVVFETEAGNIRVEVYTANAPITGANFLKYVDGKFYDGGMINRAVRPDTGFQMNSLAGPLCYSS